MPIDYFLLGACYKSGMGVEKDETKAFEHCKRSAEKGHNKAQNILKSHLLV